MLEFELPLVRGNITISDAIAEAVDSNKSGLLYEVKPGELRLIHFYGMLQAAKQKQGSLLLESVVYEPVIDIETAPALQALSRLTNASKRYGFKGMRSGGMALVLSVSEERGYPFAVVTPGRRCTRPNRPSQKSPRNWYHYPPDNDDPNDPNNCAVCGAPLQ